MARPENRKRQRSDEPSQSIHPSKRPKSAVERNYSPAFWDNLSKVPLTPRALKELDRRNTTRAPTQRKTPCVRSSDLARFARHGGPDLRHLRGYLKSKSILPIMSSSRSSTSRSRQTQSTKATTNRTRKSSNYGKEFQQHLTDHNIYMNNRRSQPKNIKEMQTELALERASLSPSKFSEGAFERFQRSNEDAVFENDVMTTVVPVLCGSSNITNRQNVLFTELTPIIDEDTVKPKPDFFDGARLQGLDQKLRDDQVFRANVIPTKHASVPVAVNFYMEAKGPDGSAAVVKTQACYGAVHGVRGMNVVQTGHADPTYDGNAYTLSSTYHAGTGTLQLYVHHATSPTTPSGRPEYHMTQLKGYALTSDRETFVAGATAFRNATELAQRYRDNFIAAANARASQTGATTAEVLGAPDGGAANGYDTSNSDGYNTRLDDALQQHVAESSNYAGEETLPPSTPQCICTEEDSQNPSQSSTALEVDDHSGSFTSSFTSVSTRRARSKRPRQPVSPTSVSKKGPASKHSVR